MIVINLGSFLPPGKKGISEKLTVVTGNKDSERDFGPLVSAIDEEVGGGSR